MRESKYQRSVVSRIHGMFDRPIILKNDANLIQGIPDLTVIVPGLVAFLEVKASAASPAQPNQEYYIGLLQLMGHFAMFIYPENEEEVFRAIRAASRTR